MAASQLASLSFILILAISPPSPRFLLRQFSGVVVNHTLADGLICSQALKSYKRQVYCNCRTVFVCVHFSLVGEEAQVEAATR